MPVEARAQTLAHLRLVAGLPGFWELRALRRQGGTRMAACGSFFIVATTTADGTLIYDRLEQAVDWADAQDRAGAEVFVGMNPRERAARGKDAVTAVTACYVDLDLPEGESQESALAAVTDGDAPLPSFVVNSGYGLHVVYLLRAASRDKATWTRLQKGLARRYASLGADAKIAGDESRASMTPRRSGSARLESWVLTSASDSARRHHVPHTKRRGATPAPCICRYLYYTLARATTEPARASNSAGAAKAMEVPRHDKCTCPPA
jgi:hypothetical protein